jgi:hypothetical protein
MAGDSPTPCTQWRQLANNASSLIGTWSSYDPFMDHEGQPGRDATTRPKEGSKLRDISPGNSRPPIACIPTYSVGKTNSVAKKRDPSTKHTLCLGLPRAQREQTLRHQAIKPPNTHTLLPKHPPIAVIPHKPRPTRRHTPQKRRKKLPSLTPPPRSPRAGPLGRTAGSASAGVWFRSRSRVGIDRP